jgi:ABC-2 type transport system permease protein
VVRSLLIGALTLVAARAFVDYPVEDPLVLAAVLVGTSIAFSALGTVVGLYSSGWEQQNVVGNLVIQPLAFLGGVFYSVDALAEPWRSLTHADPIFYMVVAARHGTLGASEVPIALSLGVTLGLAVAMLGWAWWTFLRGVGIRT